MDGVITFFTGVMIIIAFRFALYGKLNQGVISSLFSITSIYLATLAWLFFNEQLRIFHFIGMLFMIACALLIVFSRSSNALGVVEVYGDLVQEISPVWSVLFGILCTL